MVIQPKGAKYPQLIIEEGPVDPEWTRRVERAKRNLLWFGEHAVELEIFMRYRGRYVGVSEGELFCRRQPGGG